MSKHRYELKFVLDEAEKSKALSWLYTCTSGRTAHPSRTVNSIYFDDPGYSAVRDNLAGISNRQKIRLRWYHDDDQKTINGAQLEVKHRNGRLGFKDRYPLSALNRNLMSLEYRDIFPALHRQIGGDDIFLVEEYLSPALHVSYKRDYFEGLNGIRVTFDYPITFYAPLPHAKPFEGTAIAYPSSIMEIKFPTAQKDNVAASLRRLNLTPKRHSKYLVGLAAFGYALYY